MHTKESGAGSCPLHFYRSYREASSLRRGSFTPQFHETAGAPQCGTPAAGYLIRETAQIRATPLFRAASATALDTAGPTRLSKALGMM